jgi:aspartate 1-decarboxylase
MKRIMLKAKIHHARVTETDVGYEGSLSLPEDLMETVDMLPYEKVHVYNVSNGERFSTYLIKGPRGAGRVGVFGAAARRARVGDKLIVVAYAILEEEETEFFVPKILILGDANRITEIK